MAEAPPHSSGGGVGASLTRKLGPLPVWAWAAVVVVGYLLYRHFKGTSTSTSTTTDTTGTGTYVPPFDAASMSGGAGIGSGGTAGTAGSQPPQPPPDGGGTSTGPPPPGTSSGTPVSNPLPTVGESYGGSGTAAIAPYAGVATSGSGGISMGKVYAE